MDITQVKRDLPLVKIEWNGVDYWGRITGRMNQFATVSPYQPVDQRPVDRSAPMPRFEYAWETVTRAVTNDIALKV